MRWSPRARRRTAPRTEGAETAFWRILARKLAAWGLSSADLDREVERLLAKARAMRLVDGSRMSRMP